MLYIFDEMDSLDDGFMERVMPLLSEERQEKIKRLRSPLSKKASAVVYLLLRLALAELYGINEAVVFGYAKNEKPVLRDYRHIHFNLSHCKNAAACVVCDSEVGVDVQHISPVTDKVARRVLTEKEFKAFISSDFRDEFFCETWTIKESFIKKTGQGITTELRGIEAENVADRMTFKGRGYFCCVCGAKMQIKHVRSENFGQLFN